jgi:N-formylglutamate deformylase
LRGFGYKVAINYPYKGVEILRRYGKPCNNIHSIQLEIGKHLYWDRDNLAMNTEFFQLQQDLMAMFKVMASWKIDEQMVYHQPKSSYERQQAAE